MLRTYNYLVTFLLMLLSICFVNNANGASLFETLNRLNLQETTNATLGALDSMETFSANYLQWTGSVSDAGWSYSTTAEVNGKTFTLALAGSLSGVEGDTLVTTISGTGQWGTDPITVSGAKTWFFDTELGGYSENELLILTQLGSNTSWWWKAARFAGGALLGGAVGVATLATAPVSAIVVTGVVIVAALATGDAVVTAGDIVDKACQDEDKMVEGAQEACPPPEPSNPPAWPAVGEEFDLSGRAVHAVDKVDMTSVSEDRRVRSRATVDGNGDVTGYVEIGPLSATIVILADSLTFVERGQMSAYITFSICNGSYFAPATNFSYLITSTGVVGPPINQSGSVLVTGGDCEDVYGIIDAGSANIGDYDELTIIAWDTETGTMYDTCVQIIQVIEPKYPSVLTAPVVTILVLAMILAAAMIMKRRAASGV